MQDSTIARVMERSRALGYPNVPAALEDMREWSRRKISQALDIHRQTVKSLFDEFGVELPPPCSAEHRVAQKAVELGYKDSRDAIITLKEQGISQAQVARRLGTSSWTVAKISEELGIIWERRRIKAMQPKMGLLEDDSIPLPANSSGPLLLAPGERWCRVCGGDTMAQDGNQCVICGAIDWADPKEVLRPGEYAIR